MSDKPREPEAKEIKVVNDSAPTSMRVLVAEDHAPTREALRVLLERKGYQVTGVGNGDDAITTLLGWDGPSIALIDWMLPGANGLDVCRAVRTQDTGRYVYVIVITARDGEEDVAQALATGADDFLRKPCGASELVARVRTGQRIVELERNLAGRITELEEALDNVRQLRRLLPICMYCKKVRDDTDYWREIEDYIHQQTGTDFSHGICPQCMQSLDLDELRPRKSAGS
jgi:CheY-like chemotaxis protein